METLRTATLLAAVVTTGLTAGLFVTFSHTVMPALGSSSDRTLVQSMQEINVAIGNPWFGVHFVGGALFLAAALLLHLGSDQRHVLAWLVAGLVLYVAMLVITVVVNLPLNNQLAAAGPLEGIGDPAGVREQFEQRWVRWNLARTLASTAAFVSAIWALVLSARGS